MTRLLKIALLAARCFQQKIFPKKSYSKKSQGSLKEKTVSITYWPGMPTKKESYSTNIYLWPKGIMDSTDVNSINENNLDSDDEIDDMRIEKRESMSLLFVYQTDWQKRLFTCYGNELVLLDSIYRTPRYALPLFFLVIKNQYQLPSNCCFYNREWIKDCINEVLTVIKNCNQDVSPRYGMMGYCVEEINAM